MLLGLQGSPRVFMDLIHEVHKFLFKRIIVYLDGVLIFNNDYQFHVKCCSEESSASRCVHLPHLLDGKTWEREPPTLLQPLETLSRSRSCITMDFITDLLPSQGKTVIWSVCGGVHFQRKCLSFLVARCPPRTNQLKCSCTYCEITFISGQSGIREGLPVSG